MDKGLCIGLLIYGSLETVSGGYLYDRKLVEHLRAQGERVEIISLPWRDYARHLSDNISADLSARLAELKADILVQDELNHPSLFLTNRRLRGRATYPIVALVHHLRCSEKRPAWQNAFYGWVERRYLETIDGFIFNSQTTRQVVAAQGIDLAERPHVVATPAGDHIQPEISREEIIARATARGPLRVLFIGNLIPRKGLHDLLAALANLPRQDWRLTIAGDLSTDATYSRSIRRQIEIAQLGGNVDLVGRVSQEKLKDLLSGSQILAVPSSYEGYGIVYLEGMAYGLPAIAGRQGAAGEIVNHGENGYLAVPGDTKALQGYLAELINNRELLLSFSLAALRRYQAQPTWQQSAEKIRSFLAGLCETEPQIQRPCRI